MSIGPTPARPTAASTVAAFVFLGPLIGGWALTVPVGLYGIATNPGSDWAWGGALAMLFIAIPFSFLLGLLPALSVGFAAAILRSRVGARAYVVSCTSLAAAAGGGFSVVLAAILPGPGPRLDAVPWVFIMPGGVAGLACAWLTRPRDRKAT